MGNRAAGPGTPVNDEQRIRYQACWNSSDYDAPPFAAMARNAPQIVEGVRSWIVSRPTSDHENRQDANDIVFNGPEVLKSKKPGRCTVDFPATCLHLKSDVVSASQSVIQSANPLPASSSGATTGISYFVGPKADSWLLWGGKSAFAWLGADTSLGDEEFECGSVALPMPSYYGASYELGTSGMGNLAQNIPANGLIGYPTGINSPILDGVWFINLSGRVPTNTDFNFATATAFNQAHPGGGVNPQIPQTGIYEWHFHCSATSPGPAPQGSQIVIKAYIDDEPLTTYVVRTQQNEIDNYGTELGRSLENLSMTGVNRFTAGETLNFRNMSAYPVTILAGFARVRRL